MAIIKSQLTGDQTIKIFDNFYNKFVYAPVDQYNVVNAYFLGVCATKDMANIFTAFLFQIAAKSGLDPLTILDSIKGSNNKLELDQKMSYFMNSFKSKTSLYGVAIVPRPLYPTARNVVM